MADRPAFVTIPTTETLSQDQLEALATAALVDWKRPDGEQADGITINVFDDKGAVFWAERGKLWGSPTYDHAPIEEEQ